jgi:CRISPR-associated protein Csx17
MTGQLHILRFDGLHADTLGHYFAGLGLLAAVGREWPDVRGCWRNRRFLLLHESLSEQEVKGYLLDVWQPTRYQRWWADAQKADTKAKSSSEVWRLRNSHSVQEVQVLDAHLVGLSRNQFNPVFGTGGTLGQRDFADVWCECLKKARPPARPAKRVMGTAAKPTTSPTKKSKAQLSSEVWLDAALSGNDTAELPSVSAAGTWFVFANKSFNTGQDWFREGRLSPWLFLLAAEGALLLVGDVNRRLSIRARPYAVFPFVSDPAQPASPGEVGMSKGEFWAPLWDCPATIIEVRDLLKRGLARLGNRSAHAPHEFAIAALAAGTDAGVAEFVRFDLRQTTSAKVYEAVPQEHIAVSRPDGASNADRLAASALLSELIPWLNRLPFEPRDSKQRGRFRGLRGPVEGAIIRVSEHPGDAQRWQDLLLLLSRQQARIDRNKSFREKLSPLPWLQPDWFARAWPTHLPCPKEVVLARAIASIGAGTVYPLLSNLFGVDLDSWRKPTFVQGDRPPRIVWTDAEPLRVFGQLLSRRLLDTEPGGPLPLGGTCLAPLETVARLLSRRELDLDLVADWVLSLSLIDWKAARPKVRRDRLPLGGELALLGLFRPIFHENPHSLFDWLPKEPKPALARRILNLIQFGNLEEAIRAAEDYYQAAGRSVVKMPSDRSFDNDFPARLAAALLVPLRTDDIQRGLSRWLVPEKVTQQ